MKRTIVLIFVFSTIFAQKNIFTLKESIQVGLENSKNIMVAQAALKISEAKITQASSLLLPQLSFQANYARLSDVKPFEVSVPISPTPIKIQDPILNNYNMQLSILQPVFVGFKLQSLKNASEYRRDAVEEEYLNEINKEAMNIHSSFWNYYKAKIYLKLITENLKRLEKHLNNTKEFLKNGLATKNDLLKLEVEYSNVEIKKLDAKNNLEIARAAFNKSIGIKLSEETEIVTEEIPKTKSNLNFSEALNEAFENRNEIQSLKYKISAVEENVTAAASSWFPSIYLFGNYYYSNPNQRIMPLENKFNDTWDLGVTLKWNFWDWGNTTAKVEEAEQNLLSSKTAFEQLKEGIELEVYRNFLRLQSSVEKVEVSERSVISAEENYRVTSEKYNQQLASSSDLIDAEVYLFEAKINLENSLIDYKLAEVELTKSIGRKIY